MIRPLRQAHRVIWPIALLATAGVLRVAVERQQDGDIQHPIAQIDVGDDTFSWQWQERNGQTWIVGTARDERRASTGVAHVYTVDAQGNEPVYLESLARLRDGILWPAHSERQHIRLFDVVRDQWLGPPLPLPPR